jgi:hypothetical protein
MPSFEVPKAHRSKRLVSKRRASLVINLDGHESLYRRCNGTWQVTRRCSADRESAGSQNGDACWGSRDVFVVVEVRGSQELNKLVMDQIQRLVGVRETGTHIALD